MAEWVTLLLFLTGLIACVISGQSVLYALLFGLVCFCAYAGRKGSSGRPVSYTHLDRPGLHPPRFFHQGFDVLRRCAAAAADNSGAELYNIGHGVGKFLRGNVKHGALC